MNKTKNKDRRPGFPDLQGVLLSIAAELIKSTWFLMR